MRLEQLDNILSRDNPTDLYDLTKINFTLSSLSNINVGSYIVPEYEEMRMDLICTSIYGDTNHVDFLCSLNNIKNPLSVKRGNVLIYVEKDQISLFKLTDVNNDEVRKIISNKRKRTKVDPNRTKYLNEKSHSLPPNMTRTNYRPIKHQDGRVHIGGNIFDV